MPALSPVAVCVLALTEFAGIAGDWNAAGLASFPGYLACPVVLSTISFLHS